MWPFKKKDAKPADPDFRTTLIQHLESWRAIGQEFEYLGRRMIVSRHYSIAGGYPMGLYLQPGISADYADDIGVMTLIETRKGEPNRVFTGKV